MDIEKKKVIASRLFEDFDVLSIYEYGAATFEKRLADLFYFEIIDSVSLLESKYLLHPKCRHLETKSKMYRNIILDSYFFIYRIRAIKIEVLRTFHESRSLKNIKLVKKIKIN
jgi:plasmid stabilization system protein ParE